jgi:hypothetical protein
MSTDPQTPDGGYALTPDQSGTGAVDATADPSTAHHEELLRTEALAARRGNRAIARFAVVGLVAALAVGFGTWRNAVPADNNAGDSAVVDASVDTSLRATRTDESGTPAPRTSTPSEVTPPPVTIGGVAPLSEDPYLPPNAWNGGDSIDPVVPAPEPVPQNPGDETATDTTDENPSPEDPSLPELPSLPDFPDFPDHNGGSSTEESTSEPTEDENSGQTTESAGAGGTGNAATGAAESTNSVGAASATSTSRPSEPTELTDDSD